MFYNSKIDNNKEGNLKNLDTKDDLFLGKFMKYTSNGSIGFNSSNENSLQNMPYVQKRVEIEIGYQGEEKNDNNNNNQETKEVEKEENNNDKDDKEDDNNNQGVKEDEVGQNNTDIDKNNDNGTEKEEKDNK